MITGQHVEIDGKEAYYIGQYYVSTITSKLNTNWDDLRVSKYKRVHLYWDFKNEDLKYEDRVFESREKPEKLIKIANIDDVIKKLKLQSKYLYVDKEKNFEAKEPEFIPFFEETSQVIFFRSNNVLAVKSTLDYDVFDFKNLVFLDIKNGIIFENFIDSAIFNYKSGVIDRSLGDFKVNEKDIERTKKLKERFFENENIESGILKI